MATELELRLRTILEEKLNKIKPENIKAGVTIFGVTGTHGKVKLFETEEEMLQDNANEGDLAVVYGKKTQNMTNTAVFSSLTFPRTVVLSEAITTNYSVSGTYSETKARFRISGSLRSTMVSLSLSDLSYYTNLDITSASIRYTSTDGITYTRTDTYDDTFILNEDITLDWTSWNDLVGNFIICEAFKASGLLKYNSKILDNTKMYWFNKDDLEIEWHATNNQPLSATFNTKTNEIIEGSKLAVVVKKFKEDHPDITSEYLTFFKDYSGNTRMAVADYRTLMACQLVYNKESTNKFVGLKADAGEVNMTIYNVDVENGTYSNGIYCEKTGDFFTYCPFTDVKTLPIVVREDGTIGLITSILTSSNYGSDITFNADCKYYYGSYLPVPT